ncbi:MAG: hypothetical protein EXR69_02610 [Myxococcales bacterium]|nr:hypothetical protein [Myxococcales bacterium]
MIVAFRPLLLVLPPLWLVGCGPPDCPIDRPVTDADLACSCGELLIDSLTCETMYCTEDGIILGGGSCS